MEAEELEELELEAPSAEIPVTPVWREAIGIRVLRREPKPEVPAPRRLPLTRADCIDGPRPCLHVSCRHNLYTDVTWAGSLVVRDAEPEDMPPAGSCALDIAEDGAHTLEEVATALGITKERARQIEEEALAKMRGDAVLQELAN